jgi:hypothetical protein
LIRAGRIRVPSCWLGVWLRASVPRAAV